MLPAPYYHLYFDEETGEILGFWNPNNGECEYSPNILVDLETHSMVQPRSHQFRVVNGKVVSVEELNAQQSNSDEASDDDEAPAPSRQSEPSLAGGLVVDGVCYAIVPHHLSVLMLDLSIGADEVRAITYTKEGRRLVKLSRADAENVASKIAEHLSNLLVG